MTYDPRRETPRFAKRKIRFALAALGLLEAGNETKGKASCLKERCAASPRITVRGSKEGPEGDRGLRCLDASGAFFEAALRRLRRRSLR
jgi:hypothetical protein